MITVYSKDGCPNCVKAKTLLDFYEIEFEEVRIDKDDKARTFVVNEGHRAVPQFYVDKTLLVHGSFDGLNAMTAADIRARVEEINGN